MLQTKIMMALYIIAAVVLVYEACTFLHELGHLVMGLLSGYSFVSFRIGSLCLMREKGKLRFRRYSVEGTGGQCILLPPDSETPQSVPALLYHFGGGLFNLLTVCITLPLGILTVNKYLKAILYLFSAISGAQALLNLIPMKLFVPNDGYNMKLVRTSPADRITMYNMLRVLGHPELAYSEMPVEYFTYRDQGEYAGVSKIFYGNYLMDCKRFDLAEKILRECVGNEPDFYMTEAACLLFLCMMLRQADVNEIDGVYTEDLKRYLEKTKNSQIDKQCILYAYQLLCKGNEEAAQKEYEKTEKMMKDASEGERKMVSGWIEQIQAVKNKSSERL